MKRFLCVVMAAGLLWQGPLAAEATGPHHVTLQKGPEGWQLLVDGQPFYVQGVGCNDATGSHGENYLRMAKEMGANAVRTWGITPSSYFDEARKQGLMVDAGIWFNPIRAKSKESYRSRWHCWHLKEEALAYVRKMKDHPALLMWNLGNEVFAYTKDGAERRAFADFLEDLARAIHREDPNHPIVYACHGADDYGELKAYVPDVDIIGVNTYGGFSAFVDRMKGEGLDKPVLATEYGCLGAWDQRNDANNMPTDPPDQFKADNYISLWDSIIAEKTSVLGGFAFVLGEQRNQDSVTWNNLNFGDLRRPAYWTLYTLYTGRQPDIAPPKITDFRINPHKTGPHGNVEVRVEISTAETRPVTYRYLVSDIASDPLVVQPPHYFPDSVKEESPGVAIVHLPHRPGIYRVYALVADDQKNVAVADATVQVSR